VLSELNRALKRILRGLGLLNAARGVRDHLRILRAWPRNGRAREAGAADALPVPPTRLILRVSGEPDVAWFLEGGRRAAESLRASLTRNRVDLEGIESLLDFGCGCGRVTRHWKDLRAAVHGSDVNAAGIDWCRTNLPFGRFGTNHLAPPLAFGDGAFDFVYALSVFTHLPEALQSSWMREMHRVLRPGGHFLLTTHGASYLGDLDVEERRRFEAGELVVKRSEEPGSNVCGAYHPERYVREKLGEGFRVVEFVPEGAGGNPHQDLFLLRRDR
jgi:SAM-dependent methyltransferase